MVHSSTQLRRRRLVALKRATYHRHVSPLCSGGYIIDSLDLEVSFTRTTSQMTSTWVASGGIPRRRGPCGLAEPREWYIK